MIFDNLICLVPGFGMPSSANTWNSFWQWLKELETEYKVGSLILHHSNNDNQVFGTKNIVRQCATEIFVEGGDELIDKVKKNSEDEHYKLFADYVSKRGAYTKTDTQN